MSDDARVRDARYQRGAHVVDEIKAQSMCDVGERRFPRLTGVTASQLRTYVVDA